MRSRPVQDKKKEEKLRLVIPLDQKPKIRIPLHFRKRGGWIAPKKGNGAKYKRYPKHKEGEENHGMVHCC